LLAVCVGNRRTLWQWEKGGGNMVNTNITNFRKNIFGLLEQTIKYNEPINVSTKEGNAIIISEEDYNGLMETVYLSSIPQQREKIIEGLNTPLEECLPENEVKW
jgi:PHD/YefM family antitoxin component YafN of YafNO toxin-antitoxin module